MNKSEIFDFTTELLDGFELGEAVFDALLDVAQTNRENMRPWVILRTTQATQTAAPGDTYITAKTLPTDFRKWYTRFSIILTDSLGNVVRRLREVQIDQKDNYKDNGDKFYVNYATRQFFLCGSQTQSCTINLYYIQTTTKVSEDDENTWVFTSYDTFEKILAFDVAVMHKLGIDYDRTNAEQANSNAVFAKTIFDQMAEWDNELALAGTQGQDYGAGPSSSFSEMGGSTRDLIGG